MSQTINEGIEINTQNETRHLADGKRLNKRNTYRAKKWCQHIIVSLMHNSSSVNEKKKHQRS